MLADQDRQDYLAQLAHQPVYQRLYTLQRLAEAQRFTLSLDESGSLFLISRHWPLRATAQSFRFNDAGMQAALAWLITQAGDGARSPP